MLSVCGQLALQVVPLLDVSASDVLYLAGAENGLSWLVAAFGECCDVGDVEAENVPVIRFRSVYTFVNNTNNQCLRKF